MNYLLEIREFYNWMECNQVESSSICLWYALMHIANKTGWQQEFTAPIATLKLKTGMSRSAIYRARNALKQLGRIDFKDRGGKQCSTYTIIPFASQIGTQSGTQSEHYPEQYPEQYPEHYPEHYPEPLNKPNQTKPKERATRFAPPSLDEVRAYCQERGNGVDPERFMDFYASKGWKVGNQPMKDWKAAVRTWEKRDTAPPPKKDKLLTLEDIYGRRGAERFRGGS